MKSAELKRRLRGLGARLFRQGGEHEIWLTAKGATLAVPRGSSLNDITAQKILQQAQR